MTLAYIDTSAIMDWIEALSAAPIDKAVRCGPQAESILTDDSAEKAISDITVIECLNSLHTNWRSTEKRKAGYDEAWAREGQARLLELVADTTLAVRSPQPGDIEQALMWVTEMTMQGRNFRAWDALHLRMAVRWSLERGEVVSLVTSNGDFGSFFPLHPYFAESISLIVLT